MEKLRDVRVGAARGATRCDTQPTGDLRKNDFEENTSRTEPRMADSGESRL